MKPCSGRVYHGREVTSYPCSNSATIEREGEWWCYLHDPQKIKEKQERIDNPELMKP